MPRGCGCGCGFVYACTSTGISVGCPCPCPLHLPFATFSSFCYFKLTAVELKKGKPSNLFSICYFIFFILVLVYSSYTFTTSFSLVLLRLGFLHNSNSMLLANKTEQIRADEGRSNSTTRRRRHDGMRNEWRKKAIL